MLELNIFGIVYCRAVMLDFDPDNYVITETVQYPKWSTITDGFLSLLVVKVRMI